MSSGGMVAAMVWGNTYTSVVGGGKKEKGPLWERSKARQAGNADQILVHCPGGARCSPRRRRAQTIFRLSRGARHQRQLPPAPPARPPIGSAQTNITASPPAMNGRPQLLPQITFDRNTSQTISAGCLQIASATWRARSRVCVIAVLARPLIVLDLLRRRGLITYHSFATPRPYGSLRRLLACRSSCAA